MQSFIGYKWHVFTHSSRSEIRMHCGVYLLRTKIGRGKWDLKYIGFSRFLKQRLWFHQTLRYVINNLSENEKLQILVLYLDNVSDARNTETELIRKYKPVCNAYGDLVKWRYAFFDEEFWKKSP